MMVEGKSTEPIGSTADHLTEAAVKAQMKLTPFRNFNASALSTIHLVYINFVTYFGRPCFSRCGQKIVD